MGKGMEKGAGNGADNGQTIEHVADLFFDAADVNKENGLSRAQLMNKSGKALAKIVHDNGKSDLNLITLEKKSKAFLVDLLILPKKEAKEMDKARASRTKSETETIVDTILEFFRELIEMRGGKINRLAEKIFRSQASGFVDRKVNEDGLSLDKVNGFALFVSAVYIVVDGLFGVKRVGTFFKDRIAKARAEKNASA